MDLKNFAKLIRLSALKMAFNAGKNGSHLGAGLSSVEIFAALYGHVLHYNLDKRDEECRDRLVVSKGHCVLSYYSALHEVGFISDDDVDRFLRHNQIFEQFFVLINTKEVFWNIQALQYR